jgi:hypothetical protein
MYLVGLNDDNCLVQYDDIIRFVAANLVSTELKLAKLIRITRPIHTSS